MDEGDHEVKMHLQIKADVQDVADDRFRFRCFLTLSGRYHRARRDNTCLPPATISHLISLVDVIGWMDFYFFYFDFFL